MFTGTKKDYFKVSLKLKFVCQGTVIIFSLVHTRFTLFFWRTLIRLCSQSSLVWCILTCNCNTIKVSLFFERLKVFVFSKLPYQKEEVFLWLRLLVAILALTTNTPLLSLQMSNDVLDSNRHGAESSDPKCFQLYFVELSSSIWFEVKGEKVCSTCQAFAQFYELV